VAPGELGLVNLCSVAIDIAGDAVYPPCTSDWRVLAVLLFVSGVL